MVANGFPGSSAVPLLWAAVSLFKTKELLANFSTFCCLISNILLFVGDFFLLFYFWLSRPFWWQNPVSPSTLNLPFLSALLFLFLYLDIVNSWEQLPSVRSQHARYVYDLRWVEGWGSIYGAKADAGNDSDGNATRFVQLWATVPQHPATMAHLLQQGAVVSSSFQPFEAAPFFCCVTVLEMLKDFLIYQLCWYEHQGSSRGLPQWLCEEGLQRKLP